MEVQQRYINNSHTRRMLKKFLIGVIGIYSAYLTMSYLSQDLYNTQFKSINPNLPPAKFSHPTPMVAVGCLFCAIAGSMLSIYRKQPPNPISLKEKVVMGTLFSINMITTFSSLLYISYPVQVLGRNIRFLFVVLIGAFFSRVKKHHAHLRLGKHKIFIAVVITVGVLLFNFAKDRKDKGDSHDASMQWLGYLLLGISVVVDALFSDSQAYCKATFKPTANQLFTSTNLFTFIICSAFSIIEGSLFKCLHFMTNYPDALWNIVGIGILQVVGQISIYYIVANFKQHIFPLISTTRKILTVIISIFIFNHDVNSLQWLAIAIVFGGMFYQLYEEVIHQKQTDDKSSQTSSGVLNSTQKSKET